MILRREYIFATFLFVNAQLYPGLKTYKNTGNIRVTGSC